MGKYFLYSSDIGQLRIQVSRDKTIIGTIVQTKQKGAESDCKISAVCLLAVLATIHNSDSNVA